MLDIHRGSGASEVPAPEPPPSTGAINMTNAINQAHQSKLEGRTRRVGALLALLVLGWFVRADAASVSPMAVYLDHRARTGTLTLFNPGTRPEEVQIGFAFGYPTSDIEGNVELQLVEDPDADEPNAVPWMRAFPRRLVLEPGQRQVVRIMAQPPAGLAEGEYWARALIHSRGGQVAIEQQQGDVGLQVDVETVVVVAVNYRNGSVETGLEIEGASARRSDDTVVGTIDLRRTGNASFLGRILAEVVDADGNVLASTEDVLAVYRGIRRRVELELPGGGEGPLSVRYRLDTERADLPAGGPLPVEPLSVEVPVL